MTASPFPILPDEWESTRATLHAYAHGIAAIPRAMAPPHPKWWHASLRVRPTGLISDAVPIPTGGAAQFRLDLVNDRAVVETTAGETRELDLASGATGTEFADAVVAVAAELGLSGEIDRAKFENDDTREYDPEHARLFWRALTEASLVLETHRRSVDGPVGPVQLWPHGFDLAFEAFGSRMVPYGDTDDASMHPAQINFGFYPGGDAYFYANPWPFDHDLTDNTLPDGAAWHTEGWEGTMLPYEVVAAADDPRQVLQSFYARVHEVAAPSLSD